MHTTRSRNDQVPVSLQLRTRNQMLKLRHKGALPSCSFLCCCCRALLEPALVCLPRGVGEGVRCDARHAGGLGGGRRGLMRRKGLAAAVYESGTAIEWVGRGCVKKRACLVVSTQSPSKVCVL